jgi:hypothetical protein
VLRRYQRLVAERRRSDGGLALLPVLISETNSLP